MRLLITARDPATAVSFEKLIPDLLADGRFELHLLCQAPAYDILLPHLRAYSLCEPVKVSADNLQTVLDNEFNAFKPDAVLTGISGPDTGVDEATLHYAKKHGIQSFALQSFWGDMNQASKALPDVALVLDDEAVEITTQRYPEVVSIPIGSIKHKDYSNLNPLQIRAQKQPGLVEKDEVLIGFYGQPIWDLKGYQETIRAMVRQLKQWPRPFKILYRPHPKETQQAREQTLAWFMQAFGDKVFLDSFLQITDSLVVCDLVVSLFSTCGFDNLYLNEMVESPFNSSVYLWFDPDLIQWWQAYSDLEIMPLIHEELLLSVDKEEEMLEVFEQGLQPEQIQRLWHNAKQHLPNPQKSVDLVIEALLNKASALHEVKNE